ncbi:DUF3017 domain-containing protein [Actinomyces respiraculi]|uniref:DUF3017 domain-containing protein n=1 Tax=Actinomyces respiraculi TaxID=2744574 RepID=A0A7T0PX73_9ACTO|nr:DUF3017 domain-containing protein [Actinomyces respiraculi]
MGRHPRWGESRREPYSTLSVVATTLALAGVPVLALTQHHRLAVLWLACLVLGLSAVRVLRPDGTWIAARGRVFDAVFGLLLALGLFLLSSYVELPRVL